MDKGNLNVSQLAWCGLVALHSACCDRVAGSAAQDNLFLVRWLVKAEKQCRFSRELAGWIYRVLTQSELSGRRQLRLSPAVSGFYLCNHGLDTGFDANGGQSSPLPARITDELPALDKLL